MSQKSEISMKITALRLSDSAVKIHRPFCFLYCVLIRGSQSSRNEYRKKGKEKRSEFDLSPSIQSRKSVIHFASASDIGAPAGIRDFRRSARCDAIALNASDVAPRFAARHQLSPDPREMIWVPLEGRVGR